MLSNEDKIIEMLESINSKLDDIISEISNIGSDTDTLSRKSSKLDDIEAAIKKIK